MIITLHFPSICGRSFFFLSYQWHPIKVMKILASQDNEAPETIKETTTRDTPVQDNVIMDAEKKETLRQIRENMTSANMATLQRLQQQQSGRRRTAAAHRRPLHQRGSSFDPMQVDFLPTLYAQDLSLTPSTCDAMSSRSAGTTTSQR